MVCGLEISEKLPPDSSDRRVDSSYRTLGYEDRGELQTQILCGADDDPRDRMNTGRSQDRDPSLTPFWIANLNESAKLELAYGALPESWLFREIRRRVAREEVDCLQFELGATWWAPRASLPRGAHHGIPSCTKARYLYFRPDDVH